MGLHRINVFSPACVYCIQLAIPVLYIRDVCVCISRVKLDHHDDRLATPGIIRVYTFGVSGYVLVVGLLDYRDDRGENKAFISIEWITWYTCIYTESYIHYIYILGGRFDLSKVSHVYTECFSWSYYSFCQRTLQLSVTVFQRQQAGHNNYHYNNSRSSDCVTLI